MSLTVEERKAVASAWVYEGKGRLKHIIINVGTGNLRDTQELANHAAAIGADAIGSTPTVYPRPVSIDNLVQYLSEVGRVVPDTPLLYYHAPGATNVTFPMEEFLVAASEKIPSLVGIKYSSPDLFDFSRCLRYKNGKYQMMWGADELLIGAYSVGARTAIGSTYNYMAPVYARMITAFKQGKMETARKEMDRSQALVKILFKFGGDGVIRCKSVLSMLGVDVGPPRLPIMPLDDTELDALRRDLGGIGFFQWHK
ncbi:N-acetylneuraminate lyase isoform X2 [Nematostella vectensis]|nr:N-acetylneuraminate lyase isoform X2 [Nematostella vectensis]